MEASEAKATRANLARLQKVSTVRINCGAVVINRIGNDRQQVALQVAVQCHRCPIWNERERSSKSKQLEPIQLDI